MLRGRRKWGFLAVFMFNRMNWELLKRNAHMIRQNTWILTRWVRLRSHKARPNYTLTLYLSQPSEHVQLGYTGWTLTVALLIISFSACT